MGDDSQPEFDKMSLDVTGFAPHQIKVSVDEYVVSISGERRDKLGDLFVIDRKFRLDKKTALVDGVEASFDSDDGGILEIVVPKNVSAGPRTIPIAVVTSASKTSDDKTNEETEVADSADDNAQSESEPASTPADEEEQNHSTEEVANSIETVQEEDADEEEVEDEQQADVTDDDGGDVVANRRIRMGRSCFGGKRVKK